MIKAAIGVDNYKINRFIEELGKAGFRVAETAPFTEDTSILTVETEKSRLHELHRLLLRLQTDFTRSN